MGDGWEGHRLNIVQIQHPINHAKGKACERGDSQGDEHKPHETLSYMHTMDVWGTIPTAAVSQCLHGYPWELVQ